MYCSTHLCQKTIKKSIQSEPEKKIMVLKKFKKKMQIKFIDCSKLLFFSYNFFAIKIQLWFLYFKVFFIKLIFLKLSFISLVLVFSFSNILTNCSIPIKL
jgi:hypothetical protein